MPIIWRQSFIELPLTSAFLLITLHILSGKVFVAFAIKFLLQLVILQCKYLFEIS